jgi:2-keto-4-pentenoate hydratase/2-oxohepta-3-ene-1,7-dioic acid hydratase in catechol pathway
MKFARVRTSSGVRPVAVADEVAYDLSDRVPDLDPSTLADLADLGRAVRAGDLPTTDLVGADYAAPVGGVGAVIAIGMNYAAHAAESGAAPPALPVMFLKTPNTIAAPDDPFRIPPRSKKVDWEVELAFVVARRAYELGEEEDPLDYIAGFTVANDLSERTFQIEESGGQWSKGQVPTRIHSDRTVAGHPGRGRPPRAAAAELRQRRAAAGLLDRRHGLRRADAGPAPQPVPRPGAG